MVTHNPIYISNKSMERAQRATEIKIVAPSAADNYNDFGSEDFEAFIISVSTQQPYYFQYFLINQEVS